MLEQALFIALIVLFLHVTTWEGMINQWVSDLGYNWPEWIKKPLYDCPICMAPWWGSVLLVGFGLCFGAWLHPFMWVTTLFAAGGVNAVLIYIISANKEEVKALKDDEA